MSISKLNIKNLMLNLMYGQKMIVKVLNILMEIGMIFNASLIEIVGNYISK